MHLYTNTGRTRFFVVLGAALLRVITGERYNLNHFSIEIMLCISNKYNVSRYIILCSRREINSGSV